MAVKILFDSASDISAAEAAEMGAQLIPIKIRFGDEEFLDGVNITRERFFEKLSQCENLPQTSQINPAEFEEVFKKLTESGDEVVCITISSRLSGTFKNAECAAEKFGGKVFAVDSLNASTGEKLLCQYALRLAKEGLNAREIAEKLNAEKGRINVLAVLDTLVYLKKGGRISPLTAFAGEMLSIKPVIGIIEGEVRLLGKAIGAKKSGNLLTRLIKEKGVDFSMPHGVMWSGADDSKLKSYVEDSRELWADETDALPAYMIGSTIGTHIGAGAIGVAFFGKKPQ
ncbi:MAG: DegV family protein [Clostridiales bacterium]|nr:DegV family protein [Clostridiales bacterium]